MLKTECQKVYVSKITEYCYYCQKDTETLGYAGGDCAICGFSKVTPKHLVEERDAKVLENNNKNNEVTND